MRQAGTGLHPLELGEELRAEVRSLRPGDMALALRQRIERALRLASAADLDPICALGCVPACTDPDLVNHVVVDRRLRLA